MRATPHWVTVLVCLALPAFGGAARADVEVHLDSYRVQGDLAPDSTILVKPFGTDEADFGKLKKERQKETAENMRTMAPLSLQQILVQRLTDGDGFGEVANWEAGDLPEGAVVIEGSFTVLNPGNRNKRYWVGMGAGKSKVCVEGRVLDAAGELLGTFGDCRSGTGMMGFAGARSEGIMNNDLYRCGVNIADFLKSWSQGALPAPAKSK